MVIGVDGSGCCGSGCSQGRLSEFSSTPKKNTLKRCLIYGLFLSPSYWYYGAEYIF